MGPLDDVDTDAVALQLSSKLILKDLKSIESLSDKGKLDHYVSQDLARYHAVLVDKKFNEIKDLEKQHKAISQLPLDELIALSEQDILKYRQEQQAKKRKETPNEKI